MKHKNKIISFFIVLVFFLLIASEVRASVADDFEYYQKYPLYSKYEKKQQYSKYKKYVNARKESGLDTAAKLQAAKIGYNNYKLYKKDPKKYASFAKYLPEYNAYKKYSKYSDYKKYKKYKNFDKKEYDKYKKYGSDEYKAGYDRYVVFMNDLSDVTTNTGPEIKVGLWSYDKGDLQDSPFKITANKIFNVTDCASEIIGQIPVGENARVTYVGNPEGTLEVYNSDTVPIIPTTSLNGGKVCFEANDGDSSDMIFDVNRPSSDYDQYRGKIKLQYSNTSDNATQEGESKRIWVINILPLEQYIWGFGEISGGVEEHSKAMIVAARTYARWYIEYSTKWAEEGFHILSTSSSQIYRGYDYEKDHDTIPKLAKKTNGIIMKNQNGDIALAAYSSWSDGRTRKYEDGMFGGVCKSVTSGDISSIYPELSAVDDPYGKNSSMSTCDLATAGNHMVGMIANGSLVMARDYGKSYTAILSHYYTGISIVKSY